MSYIYWEHEKIGPNKTITDIVMFYEASNVQIGGELINFYYPKLTVMRRV